MQKSGDGSMRIWGVCPAFWKLKSELTMKNCEEAHLLKVLTHLRPGLVHCYDLADFPRTNNEMERMIRAIKMQYRRISGRKNWNNYLLRYGRCVAYHEWWLHQPDGEAQLQARLRQVTSSSWRQVRQETRQCHLEQLNRFRFRHRPLEYLTSLEMRWEQTIGT